ncbi:hypothetical protein Lal_00036198 [Lupinus albus]|uniref:Uncharacterized protein n=1 Tax=Lupinus albus TaxID=3870 RepID=A0A6A4QLL1_LUPAL|nr:hypothetical protein Lalb_Chr04g0249371 [Lupinus albus]KAF1868760.1 hypothetical protein Lal_00036198 [Lupinus albus]
MVKPNHKKMSDDTNSRKNNSLRPRVNVSNNENELLVTLIMQLASMMFFAYTPQDFSAEEDVIFSMYKKYCGVSDESHLEVNKVRKITQMLSVIPIDQMNYEDLNVLKESLKSLKQKLFQNCEENLATDTNTHASSSNK